MYFIQFNSRAWRRSVTYLLVVLGLGVGQFFLWPQISLVAQNWQQIRMQGEQLIQLRQKVAELENNFTVDQELFSQLTVIAPLQERTAQLLERLESVAITQQVTVQTQGINQETGEKIKPVSFTVQATGSPAALLRYMSALEHLPELVTVRSWKLTPLAVTGTQPAGTPLSYALSMNILFYLQPSAITSSYEPS